MVQRASRKIEAMEYEIGKVHASMRSGKSPDLNRLTFASSHHSGPRSARAIEAGVESMLAFRLFVSDETLGALDLYGSRRGAFDEAARAFGTVFAAHAALALAGEQVHEHDLEVADGLRQALLTRDVIGQAKGILMVKRRIDADGAFDLLARVVPRSECEVASGCRARRRHMESSRTMI